MSIVPEIERQLRDAAERRSQGLLTRVFARGRSVRSRLLVRPLVVGLAVLVSGAGVALAAKALVGIGSPAPRVYPNLGERILPAGTRLLSLRVPDPAGGPPWGMRLIFTTARPGFPARPANADGAKWGCVQIGRVVDGELGVLGQDGAFHDDGLFHELPVQPEACGSVNRAGKLVGLTGGSSVTASGYRGLEGCVTESDRRQEQTTLPSIERESAIARAEGDAQGVRAALESLATYRRIAPKLSADPVCPAGDLRSFAYGVAGPRARSVTVTGEGLNQTIRLDPRDDGAYLVVQRPAASARSLAVEAQTLRRTVRYENGRSCPEESGPSCVAKPSGSIDQRRDLEASASPGTSTAIEAAPSSALSRKAEADPATPNPVTVTPAVGGSHTAFKLMFRTLLNGGGYSYLVKTGGPHRCQRAAESATGGDGVAIGGRPIVRGETITKILEPPRGGLCRGRYTIYVAFSDPKASSLQNFPFATAHFVVTG